MGEGGKGWEGCGGGRGVGRGVGVRGGVDRGWVSGRVVCRGWWGSKLEQGNFLLLKNMIILLWIINHCLGLGHETMVCAGCLTMFLWITIDQYLLLSSISKVFEKVVFLQISSYFIEINVFYDGQYGFRENIQLN